MVKADTVITYFVGSIEALRLTILGPSLCLSFFSQPTHLGQSTRKNTSEQLATLYHIFPRYSDKKASLNSPNPDQPAPKEAV